MAVAGRIHCVEFALLVEQAAGLERFCRQAGVSVGSVLGVLVSFQAERGFVGRPVCVCERSVCSAEWFDHDFG